MSIQDTEPRFASSADGTQIAVYDFGGNGPDLLLGHATGFCAKVWQPVAEQLIEHFRVVAYDLRGHGRSQSPGGDRGAWDWSHYAEDAHAALQLTGLQHPYSVGHSCGAATALLLEQAHPGTFRAMVGFEPVMFDANPPTGPDENRDLAVRTRARRRSFDSYDAAFDNFAVKGPFTKLHPDALRSYVNNGFAVSPEGITLRCRPEDEAAVYVMASAHTGFVHLASVECPVTVVRGSESVAFDEETLVKVAQRVQNGTFVQVHGVGHFGALEDPQTFVDIVINAFGVAASR